VDLGDISAERAVLNLLHRYAERVDRGDFDGVGELFEHGDYHMGDGVPLRGAEVARAMRNLVIVDDGGRPGTKHVVSNTILETDGDAIRARSYFTVFQARPDLALQPIITGRYLDVFRRVDGAWAFADRRIEVDQVGDLSHHLRRTLR
jgi:3-phenylpropionate/cinnamic acid dioxygenase small subunit